MWLKVIMVDVRLVPPLMVVRVVAHGELREKTKSFMIACFFNVDGNVE